MRNLVRIGTAALLLGAGGLLAAQGAGRQGGSPRATGFDSYKLVVERNIFDPGRRPETPGSTRPRVSTAPAVSTILLAGAVVREDARTAIFTSSIADHSGRRVTGDTIAGLVIESIDTTGVTLAMEGTSRKWPVGGILRRIDDGDWYLPEAPGAATDITKDPAAEAAILKRMRERRLQESTP